MYTEISVRGFRSFEQLSVTDVGRVNLLVGENAAGKTSFLEAVRLLGAAGNPAALYASAMERGEYEILEEEDDERGPLERAAALQFLFYGRNVQEGSTFEISAIDNANKSFRVVAEIFDASTRDPDRPGFVDLLRKDSSSASGTEERGMFPEWALRLNASEQKKRRFDVPVYWSPTLARRLQLTEPPTLAKIRSPKTLPVFLRANSLEDATLAHLWDGIVGTPAKEAVIQSLQRIEPSVRDLDLRAERKLPFRSRVVVRLSNGKEAAAPIGSLGEGITWLFALSLGAAATPGRFLFVDDIDAGLHHRVMENMWLVVLDAARRRNLQVFATTHNIDCLTALRRACNRDPSGRDDIRVIRLVKGRSKGITFTADELQTAIDGEIEVRG